MTSYYRFPNLNSYNTTIWAYPQMHSLAASTKVYRRSYAKFGHSGIPFALNFQSQIMKKRVVNLMLMYS